MNEHDEHQRRLELDRGEKAERLLSSLAPVIAARRKMYLAAWHGTKVEDMQAREGIWHMIKALDTVQADIKSDIESGEMAKIQLDEAEQAKKRAKHGD